jgi:UDP-2-acetamido-3-amino-2,3-dideoxy-glucuronate N-acetyltransferase
VIVIDPTAVIHASADLEPRVSIGPGARIWHRAQIRTGAHIGAATIVGRDAFIDEGVVIGDRVKIQNQALVYHGVTVEDEVFIGPNVILTNDRHPRAVTATGDLARSDDWTVIPITLRRACSIGAGAIVVAGVEVGAFAMIGAGAVVTRTVPAHALVVGNPARRLGWVCACGISLLDESTGKRAPAAPAAGDGTFVCPSCDRRYVYVPAADAIEDLSAIARQGAIA